MGRISNEALFLYFDTRKKAYVLMKKGQEDKAECILAEDFPSGSSTVSAQIVYLTGEFNQNAVITTEYDPDRDENPDASSDSMDAIKRALRKYSIFLSESQGTSFQSLEDQEKEKETTPTPEEGE